MLCSFSNVLTLSFLFTDSTFDYYESQSGLSDTMTFLDSDSGKVNIRFKDRITKCKMFSRMQMNSCILTCLRYLK